MKACNWLIDNALQGEHFLHSLLDFPRDMCMFLVCLQWYTHPLPRTETAPLVDDGSQLSAINTAEQVLSSFAVVLEIDYQQMSCLTTIDWRLVLVVPWKLHKSSERHLCFEKLLVSFKSPFPWFYENLQPNPLFIHFSFCYLFSPV